MPYAARLDGVPVHVVVGPDSVRVGAKELPYVDVDAVEVDGWAVTFRLAAGDAVTATHLGTAKDTLLLDLRARRLAARRSALLMWTGDAPLGTYQTPGTDPTVVSVFPDGITVESDARAPHGFPLGVSTVTRDGYRLALALPGHDAVVVGPFGKSTDTLLDTIARAQRDLAARASQAYRDLDDGLAGFSAPDGWAVDASAAGHWWGALRDAIATGGRAEEVAHLAELAGDRLRAGVKADVRGGALPFVLAPVGGRVAVEAVDADDRATFVFATDDVDQLNLALLLTSFRREAVSLPEDRLGRWALAARIVPEVAWLRQALVARVVHDEAWAGAVTQALRG